MQKSKDDREKSSDPVRPTTQGPVGEIQPLLLTIDRAELDESDRRAIQWLNGLLASKQVAMESKGRLWIAIDGFNEDPRELFLIPEVCEFYRRIHAEWPYWFFFVGDYDWAIQVIAKCIVPPDHERNDGSVLTSDLQELFIKPCFLGLNELSERYGLSREQNTELWTKHVKKLETLH